MQGGGGDSSLAREAREARDPREALPSRGSVAGTRHQRAPMRRACPLSRIPFPAEHTPSVIMLCGGPVRYAVGLSALAYPLSACITALSAGDP